MFLALPVEASAHVRRPESGMIQMDVAAFGGDMKKLIADKRRQMHEAADNLDFETAALIRDEIQTLEKETVRR